MSYYEFDQEMGDKYELEQIQGITHREAIPSGQKDLKRDLRRRHMVMIAISGTIGTGLFVTSGSTIAASGPGGAVLAYVIVGIWLAFVCQAIGEISTLLPLSGAFNVWGSRIFDEALSFQMSWIYFANCTMIIPAQLAAAALVFNFWLPEDSNFPEWVMPLFIIILMFIVSLIGVKAYGEIEYWISLVKIVAIIMFIVCGILVDTGALGGVKYGMKAWHVEGAPFKGGFIGFIGTLVTVGYTYGGTEMISLTAAECRNPHKHVPIAVNTVLIRIALFYVTSIFVLGSIVSNDDPLLVNDAGTAAAAPFTIIFAKAGMSAAVNYLNIVIFTSVCSALNSDFYMTTRMLLALSRNGWAPRSIGYINARGVPVIAVGIVTACSCLSLIIVFVGSKAAFQWFVSIIGTIVFQSWILILLLHFRFRYCWKAQGRPVVDLPYVSWGYPYGTILATLIGFCCVISTLYLAVIDLPHYPGDEATPEAMSKYHSERIEYARGIFGAWFPWICSICLFISYKLIRKTKFVKAEEADLDTGRFVPTESDKEDMRPHGPAWKRILKYIT
ncbi:hypothetical protein BGZ51_004014 [Haplosporangium sp. Z 767]|nr:hypothetical protein BGZ50_008861 [Haplosporangium sp. Z 11]KAF9183473.1 hypothetical protein BGZ51_004014 [Haplosporangium sp. Z 767]